MQQPPPPYPIEDFYHRRLPAPAYEAPPPPRLFHGPVVNHMDPGLPNERLVIWAGTFEWVGKSKVADDPRTLTTQTFGCQISCTVTPNGEPEVYADMWPRKLVMQLIPKQLVTGCSEYLKNARQVVFHFSANPELLGSLSQSMSSGYAGCVQLSQNETNIRIIVLLYNQAKRAYIGFVVHDQQGLVSSIRQVIQSYRTRVDKIERPRPPQHLPVPPWGHTFHQQEPQPIQKVVGWLTHQYPYGGPSTSTADNTPCRYAPSATATPTHQVSPPRKRKRNDDSPSSTTKSVKVTKHNANIIDETFSCIVCQGPMRHPVVTNCCKSLVACKQCSINWAGESNTCLKCRADNPVYTEVRGLHEGIGALKDTGFFD